MFLYVFIIFYPEIPSFGCIQIKQPNRAADGAFSCRPFSALTEEHLQAHADEQRKAQELQEGQPGPFRAICVSARESADGLSAVWGCQQLVAVVAWWRLPSLAEVSQGALCEIYD